MSTWDLFAGNKTITNWAKISVKEANLTKNELKYVKAIAQKSDAQEALDKYMKYTGWHTKRVLKDSKLTCVYIQSPISKRLDTIRYMTKVSQRYLESMK